MFYVREYWLENFGAVVGVRAPLFEFGHPYNVASLNMYIHEP